MTNDLVTFLHARLDDDEQVAQVARAEDSGWYGHEAAAYLPAADVAHIRRHDPIRVLAEVETKRAIVDHLAREMDDSEALRYDGKLGHVLKLLALPYAWHDDYRPEWLP